MYHSSVPWPVYVFLLFGFSWTTIFVMGGAIGVLLKSKISERVAYTERDGFRCARRSKCIVTLT